MDILGQLSGDLDGLLTEYGSKFLTVLYSKEGRSFLKVTIKGREEFPIYLVYAHGQILYYTYLFKGDELSKKEKEQILEVMMRLNVIFPLSFGKLCEWYVMFGTIKADEVLKNRDVIVQKIETLSESALSTVESLAQLLDSKDDKAVNFFDEGTSATTVGVKKIVSYLADDVDNQEVITLEQELRNARKFLARIKETLTTITAEEKSTREKVREIQRLVAEHEECATKALEVGNKRLAFEMAKKISEFKEEIAFQKLLIDTYRYKIIGLKKSIFEVEKAVISLEREIDLIYITHSINRSQGITDIEVGSAKSTLLSAIKSVNRIKEKEKEKDLKIKKVVKLSQEGGVRDFKEKLKSANVLPAISAVDILEDLKKR